MNHIQTSQKPSTDYKVSTPAQSESSMASFWDESQVQAVIRHAGATGRSPEEFLTPFLPISDPFNSALKRPTQKANS